MSRRVRYELTQAEKQVVLWSKANETVRVKLRAGAARLQLVQEQLACEEQMGRHLCGEDIDAHSESDLLALRAQLATAQDRVASMLERRAAEARVLEKFPHYRCSIALSLMRDPVVAQDGQSYERTEIERWFRQCTDAGEPVTSPLRAPLASDALVPNNSLRRAIDDAVDLEVELDLVRAGGPAKRARIEDAPVGV